MIMKNPKPELDFADERSGSAFLGWMRRWSRPEGSFKWPNHEPFLVARLLQVEEGWQPLVSVMTNICHSKSCQHPVHSKPWGLSHHGISITRSCISQAMSSWRQIGGDLTKQSGFTTSNDEYFNNLFSPCCGFNSLAARTRKNLPTLESSSHFADGEWKWFKPPSTFVLERQAAFPSVVCWKQASQKVSKTCQILLKFINSMLKMGVMCVISTNALGRRKISDMLFPKCPQGWIEAANPGMFKHVQTCVVTHPHQCHTFTPCKTHVTRVSASHFTQIFVSNSMFSPTKVGKFLVSSCFIPHLMVEYPPPRHFLDPEANFLDHHKQTQALAAASMSPGRSRCWRCPNPRIQQPSTSIDFTNENNADANFNAKPHFWTFLNSLGATATSHGKKITSHEEQINQRFQGYNFNN